MATDNGLIRLNVGGTIFQTTTQTLRKEPDSFFARFCEVDGIEPGVKDESGAFFIDRDPRYFRIILNYLRSDAVHFSDNVSVDELLVEADFYCLAVLSKRLEDFRGTAATKEDDQPTVKTVAVVIHPGEPYRGQSYFASSPGDVTPSYTKFVSSNSAVLQRIASTEKVRRFVREGDPQWNRILFDSLAIKSKIFSKADVCDVLGQCGLVLRHVEKDANGRAEQLYFST
ncbi:BTB/POZ domain-containing protein KCTD17 [Aphelenchoides avenae]|nr:BTB/POZ domain-containing protein KCTD17 [Aphelenchus avenae]